MNTERINQAIDNTFDTSMKVTANFATNIVPLLVGILPASITWQHLFMLYQSPALAWIGAIVIEFLGFAAALILTEFAKHNKTHTAESDRMSTWQPLLSFGWYLAIMIVFNVLLTAFPNNEIVKILSVALFSTLAIPAYVLTSAKNSYAEWKVEHVRALAEQKAEQDRAAAEHKAEQERMRLEQKEREEREYQAHQERLAERREQRRAKQEQKQSIVERSAERPQSKQSTASEYTEQIRAIAEQGERSPIKIARILAADYGMEQDPRKATGYISTLLKNTNGHKGA